MGLDGKIGKWLNQSMQWKMIRNVMAKVVPGMRDERIVRVSPEDREYEALRANMRGQFMKLKEKGLSIRIITL